MSTVDHLRGFGVIELRRYTIQTGGRQSFARYFESYFPEAHQQLGALALGHFFERARPDHFTWLRGYKDMDARAVVNASLYYGALWKEHKPRLNALIVDNDDVLLLQPLCPATEVLVLPAVDVVEEERGATGVAVAQIFAVRAGDIERCAAQAEPRFKSYSDTGLREAGVLVSLDVPNNFPQLPVRTDGPFLVWLGLCADEAALERFLPRAGQTANALAAGGLLRGETELLVLDPAQRSRLRWLSEWPVS